MTPAQKSGKRPAEAAEGPSAAVAEIAEVCCQREACGDDLTCGIGSDDHARAAAAGLAVHFVFRRGNRSAVGHELVDGARGNHRGNATARLARGVEAFTDDQWHIHGARGSYSGVKTLIQSFVVRCDYVKLAQRRAGPRR